MSQDLNNALIYMFVGFLIGLMTYPVLPAIGAFVDYLFGPKKHKAKSIEEKIEEAGLFTTPESKLEKRLDDQVALSAISFTTPEDVCRRWIELTRDNEEVIKEQILKELSAKNGENLANAFQKDRSKMIIDRPARPIADEEKAIIEKRKSESEKLRTN